MIQLETKDLQSATKKIIGSQSQLYVANSVVVGSDDQILVQDAVDDKLSKQSLRVVAI
jgi:hypothetical protein